MKEYLTNTKRIWHPLVNLWRRYKKGAGCCDVFNADYYLAKKILPVLKEYRRQNDYSYPSELTQKEWKQILDDMIWAFQYKVDGEEPVNVNGKLDVKASIELEKRAQRGYELFGKYFRNLWI